MAGGLAATLVDLGTNEPSSGGTWSPLGVILFSRPGSGPLYRIPASGGVAAEATRVGANGEGQFAPWFLPGGKNFVFVQGALGAAPFGARIGSLGSMESRALGESSSSRVIYGSGHLLLLRGSVLSSDLTLMAQAFDTDRFVTIGDAVPLAEGVAVRNYDVAANGTLVYGEAPGVIGAPMAWYDRQGKKLGDLGSPALYSNPALSPDGKRLAVGIGAVGSRDIWVFDLTRGVPARFTFDPKDDLDSVWSPDGSRIAFSSDRTGLRDIYRELARGAGSPELLLGSKERKNVEGWSPDGKFILYNVNSSSVWAVPIDGDRKPFAVLKTSFSERQSSISPDGHWIAYESLESGRDEIFIQSFPPSSGKWQISNAGGSQPSWRGDGKELFFLNGTKIMAVDIRISGGGVEAGLPHELFDVPDLLPLPLRNSYLATPDGQRFLVCVVTRADANANRLTVVQNWPSLLKK